MGTVRLSMPRASFATAAPRPPQDEEWGWATRTWERLAQRFGQAPYRFNPTPLPHPEERPQAASRRTHAASNAAMLLVAGALLAGEAVACSCGPATLEEKISASAYIFVGRATATTHSGEDSDIASTRFVIKEMLKGEPASELVVSHPEGGGGNCGVNFGTTKDYLIVAVLDETGMPTTSLCERVMGEDEAPIRAVLEKGKK